MTRRLSSSSSAPPKSDDDSHGVVPRISGFDLPHSRSATEFRKRMRNAESQATNPSAASSRTPSASAEMSSWRPIGWVSVSICPWGQRPNQNTNSATNQLALEDSRKIQIRLTLFPSQQPQPHTERPSL